jgi:putative ABC transport system permease protein
MALGAQPMTILRMVSRQGFAIIGFGLAFGIGIAVSVGSLVGDFLVGVGATDPLAYITLSIVLSLVVLAACYVPVRRAISVDPMGALRYE